MACCSNQFEALFQIVKSAYDCCGAQIDPELEPSQCDSPEELWVKWGCIQEACACDIIDPEPCFANLQPIQPPPLLVAADNAGCLFSTIPYNAINLDQGGGVGVFDQFDGALNQFQFRALASPSDTVSINLNAPLIELETNPVETNDSGNVALNSGSQAPISINVPSAGFYQINISAETTDQVGLFQADAIGINIGQSLNYSPNGSPKKLAFSYNSSLAGGVQNVANVLFIDGVIPVASADYVIQIVKIGP